MTDFDFRIYMPDTRLEYYCMTCGKLRLGPLPSEANNMNMPCEKCGSMSWTTKVPDNALENRET